MWNSYLKAQGRQAPDSKHWWTNDIMNKWIYWSFKPVFMMFYDWLRSASQIKSLHTLVVCSTTGPHTHHPLYLFLKELKVWTSKILVFIVITPSSEGIFCLSCWGCALRNSYLLMHNYLGDFFSFLQVSQAGILHLACSLCINLVPSILNECILKKWSSLWGVGKTYWCWHQKKQQRLKPVVLVPFHTHSIKNKLSLISNIESSIKW